MHYYQTILPALATATVVVMTDYYFDRQWYMHLEHMYAWHAGM